MRPAILPERPPGIVLLVVSWLQSCVRFVAFCLQLPFASSMSMRFSSVPVCSAGDSNPQVAGSIPAGRTIQNKQCDSVSHLSLPEKSALVRIIVRVI